MKEEQIGTKRICRKCLTKDMDEKDYLEKIQVLVANLDADVKVKQEIYEKRLAVCRECDFLADGTCRACGCFVELRAAVRKNSCPYNKWKATK